MEIEDKTDYDEMEENRTNKRTKNRREKVMGRHSTKVAFALPTQPSRVRFLPLLGKNDPNKKNT